MKVLIVDDEVIIRNGLSSVIHWEELGFSLLAPASSAEEALARIPDERPHIVLTDIRMNGKSGLELIREVKNNYPDIEFIVLSGYDEFSYAQSAMREGVEDYLLKTSRPDDIIKAVIRTKQRVLKRWEGQKREKVNQGVIRNGLLEKLLFTEHPLERAELSELERLSPYLSLNAPGVQSLQALLLSPHGWGDSAYYMNLLQYAVGNMLTELLECESMEWKGKLVLIVKQESVHGGEDTIKAGIARTEKKLKCSLFVAAGSLVYRLDDLKTSFDHAAQAYDYSWLMQFQGYIRYEAIKERRGIGTVCSMEEESEIISVLKNGDPIELREWVVYLLNRLRGEPEVTPESMNAYLHSILLAGYRWLERVASSVGVNDLLPDHKLPPTDALISSPEDALYKQMLMMIDVYQKMASGKVLYIRQAVDYIRENLHKNISLQEVANYIHVNPNYFSERFKRETGQNYIEFVTNERMKKAMAILEETPAKISEVAKWVGYEDIKYFSQLFKKHTGLTPSEFRKNTEISPPSN